MPLNYYKHVQEDIRRQRERQHLVWRMALALLIVAMVLLNIQIFRAKKVAAAYDAINQVERK